METPKFYFKAKFLIQMTVDLSFREYTKIGCRQIVFFFDNVTPMRQHKKSIGR